MSVPSVYYEWLDHFHSNSDYLEKTHQFLLQNAKDLGLDKAESMVSIGAGEGLIDSYVLRNCTPELKHYTGVEPDEHSFNELKSAIPASTDAKVTLFNEGMPGWEGPTGPVDVVFLSHCLYLIPDRMSVVRRCYEKWLKPGGTLIMLMSFDDTIFADIGKRHKDYKRYTYYYDSLKQELDTDGFTYCEGDKIEVQMPGDYGNDDLVRLYFICFPGDCSDAQMNVLIKDFRKTWAEGGNRNIQSNGCIYIRKPMI